MISALSITIIIIAINVIMHFITENNGELKRKMLFNAYQIKHHNEWYRWLSHAFIHGDFGHLAINMFVLWMFGQEVERHLSSANTQHSDFLLNNGPMFYIVLYIGGVLFSSMRSFFKHQDNPRYNSLGASGATSALLFAFIVLNPISMFYGIIPAFIFGILYLWYENSQGKRGGTGIAHDAHFWGAVFGCVAMAAVDPHLISEFPEKIKLLPQMFGR